jgi:hypothetical protein
MENAKILSTTNAGQAEAVPVWMFPKCQHNKSRPAERRSRCLAQRCKKTETQSTTSRILQTRFNGRHLKEESKFGSGITGADFY